MFDATLETRPVGGATGRVGSVGAAAGIHLVVAGLAIGGSYLILQLPPDPATPHDIFVIVPPPSQDVGGAPERPAPKRPETAPRASPAESLEQPRPTPDGPPGIEPEPETPVEDLGTGAEGSLGSSPDGPPGSGGRGVGEGQGDGTGNGPLGPRWLDGEMTAPRLLSRVEPSYPEVLRRARVPGTVVLQAIVSESGRVEGVEILSASNPLFGDAAREAVLRWRYAPALQNGSPVRVYFTVRVVFEVR